MPSRAEALAALRALPKISLPSTSTPPSRSGMTYSPDHTPRTRDVQRAAKENPVEKPVAMTPENEPWEIKAARLRREGEARRAEKARIAAAREAARQRDLVDDAERTERINRIVLENVARSEVRQILQDATAEELQAVLKLVNEWKMRNQPFAYKIALQQVREKSK